MKNAFFFQTKQIPDPEIIFDQFKQRAIFFSYFQVDQKYYLFFYSQKPMEIDFLYQAVDVIQELDSNIRKIRSLRGFLLYALNIMGNEKDYEILSTNLQPFFWKKVENIIRQNKKGALQEFLFGSQLNHSDSENDLQKDFQERLQTNQKQILILLQRVFDLENKIEKYLRRRQNKASEAIKSIQQEDYITATQAKAQNEDNFIALGKISEQEKVDMIKLGFQLNQDGKISLKKYYEEKGEHTLFESKGYQIKYDTIRKTHLYLQLKFGLGDD